MTHGRWERHPKQALPQLGKPKENIWNNGVKHGKHPLSHKREGLPFSYKWYYGSNSPCFIVASCFGIVEGQRWWRHIIVIRITVTTYVLLWHFLLMTMITCTVFMFFVVNTISMITLVTVMSIMFLMFIIMFLMSWPSLSASSPSQQQSSSSPPPLLLSPSLLPPPHPPQPTDLAYNSVSSLSEQFPAALQGEAALRMPQLWKTHIKKNRRASTVGYKISMWILWIAAR